MDDSAISSARRHPLLAHLVRLLEAGVIVVMGLLVLDVLWGVLSRILSNWGLLENPASWTEELARYLLIWVGLLGACLAFEKRAHLGVDYFVGKFHPVAAKVLAILSLTVVLLFALLALLVGGWQLVSRTLELGQTTPTLGIPKGWVYLAVPLSGIFTAIFTGAQIADVLRSPDANEAPGDEGGRA